LKNRDELLTEIRPKIVVEAFSKTIETFQNQTLRPILKLQNDLIETIFKNQLKRRKVNFERMDLADKKLLINRFLKEDNHFKALYLGIIIGHFTNEEADFYFEYESESSKRIMTMMIERIQSWLKEIG
jgi:hypothetical protein